MTIFNLVFVIIKFAHAISIMQEEFYFSLNYIPYGAKRERVKFSRGKEMRVRGERETEKKKKKG